MGKKLLKESTAPQNKHSGVIGWSTQGLNVYNPNMMNREPGLKRWCCGAFFVHVCVCVCVWNGCQAVLPSTAPVFLLLHSRVIIALSLSFTLSLSPFPSSLLFSSLLFSSLLFSSLLLS